MNNGYVINAVADYHDTEISIKVTSISDSKIVFKASNYTSSKFEVKCIGLNINGVSIPYGPKRYTVKYKSNTSFSLGIDRELLTILDTSNIYSARIRFNIYKDDVLYKENIQIDVSVSGGNQFEGEFPIITDMREIYSDEFVNVEYLGRVRFNQIEDIVFKVTSNKPVDYTIALNVEPKIGAAIARVRLEPKGHGLLRFYTAVYDDVEAISLVDIGVFVGDMETQSHDVYEWVTLEM
jgi:hypothetical protein